MIRNKIRISRDINNNIKFDKIRKLSTFKEESDALKLFGTLDVKELHEAAEAAWMEPECFDIDDDTYANILPPVVLFSRALYNSSLLGDDVNIIFKLAELYSKKSQDKKFEVMYNIMIAPYIPILNNIIGCRMSADILL